MRGKRLRHEHVPHCASAVHVGRRSVVDDVDAAVARCVDPGEEREVLGRALIHLHRRAPRRTVVGRVAEERAGMRSRVGVVDLAPDGVDVAGVVDCCGREHVVGPHRRNPGVVDEVIRPRHALVGRDRHPHGVECVSVDVVGGRAAGGVDLVQRVRVLVDDDTSRLVVQRERGGIGIRLRGVDHVRRYRQPRETAVDRPRHDDRVPCSDVVHRLVDRQRAVVVVPLAVDGRERPR